MTLKKPTSRDLLKIAIADGNAAKRKLDEALSKINGLETQVASLSAICKDWEGRLVAMSRLADQYKDELRVQGEAFKSARDMLDEYHSELLRVVNERDRANDVLRKVIKEGF